MATTKTKLVALATIVLGAGAKAREIAAGQEFSIDDDQVQRLLDVGAASLPEAAVAPTAEDEAAKKAAAEKAEADRLAAEEALRQAGQQGKLT